MLFCPTMYHFVLSSPPAYCAHWSQTSSVYVTVKYHTHMKLQKKTMVLYILMCVI